MARGRECQIRIPGVCNGNPETTVLCHPDGAGVGRKHHDMLGAWGCSSCHDLIDGRRETNYKSELVDLWFADGVQRTQIILIDERVIGEL